MGVGKMGVGKMGVGKMGVTVNRQNICYSNGRLGNSCLECSHDQCTMWQYMQLYTICIGFQHHVWLWQSSIAAQTCTVYSFHTSIAVLAKLPMTPMLNCIPLTLDGCVLAVLLQSSKSCFSSPPKVLLQKAFVIGDLSLQGASTGHNY